MTAVTKLLAYLGNGDRGQNRQRCFVGVGEGGRGVAGGGVGDARDGGGGHQLPRGGSKSQPLVRARIKGGQLEKWGKTK